MEDPRRDTWPNLHVAFLDLHVVLGRCFWFCYGLYCAIRTPSSILQDVLSRTVILKFLYSLF